MKKFVSKIIYFLEQVIRGIFFPKIYGLKVLKKILADKRLIVTDIGSTGGLERSWHSLNSLLKTYSFDPDNRAVNIKEDGIVFPYALWSSKGRRHIYLTSFPPASSLLIPNKRILENFLVSDAHDIIGKKIINTYKLDDVLKDYEASDFIKIDAEGADFEILLGARKQMDKNCLGIQIEVQFIERNLKSPLFNEIDPFLRERGFELINIKKEYWLRKNKKWGPGSQMQLIWGDALYLVSIPKLIKLISKKSISNRKLFMAKFSLICAVFGAHDYAFEALEVSEKNELIDHNSARLFKAFINMNVASISWTIIRDFNRLLVATLLLLVSFIFYKYYRKSYSLFKYSAKNFFLTIAILASRAGGSKSILNDY